MSASLPISKTARGSTEEHTRLVAETRLALGSLPDFRLWLNSRVSIIRGKPLAKPGLGKGTLDLIGILAPAGRLVALDAKTGSATPTREQKMFIALIRRMGGFAATFGSVDEAFAALERARNGLTG